MDCAAIEIRAWIAGALVPDEAIGEGHSGAEAELVRQPAIALKGRELVLRDPNAKAVALNPELHGAALLIIGSGQVMGIIGLQR